MFHHLVPCAILSTFLNLGLAYAEKVRGFLFILYTQQQYLF